jgi:O-antigen/teichoic acid export membrane protein
MPQAFPQVSYAMALWIPAILNGAIGTQAHQYIVGHYFDPFQYAIYAVACFQVPFVAILTNSIGEILLVRATEYCSQGRRLDLYTLWMNVCRKALLVYVAIAAVLMVLARPIIVTIFTSRYRASAPLFAVMVLGLVSYGIFQDGLFRACSAMKTYGMFYALRAGLSVGLGFAGLRLWGLWGVALSSVLAIGIVNLLQLVPAAKLLQVPFGKVLPWKDVTKMLLAAGVAASGVGILLHTFASHVIILIAGFPLFGILYGGLVIKLGVISGAEVLVVLREIRTCFHGRFFTQWKRSLATQGF